jgi:hypothetical protein
MATDKSTHSGSWDSSSTWSNGVPTTSREAVISRGENVTIDDKASASAVASSVDVTAHGQLTLQAGVLSAGSTNVEGELAGSGKIEGAVVGDGIVVAQGGVLEVTGSVGADDNGLDLRVDNSATLKLDGQVGAESALLNGDNNTVVDLSGKSVLDLTGEGSGSSGELDKFQASVQSFDSTDKIEVTSSGRAGDTVHFNANTDILTVTAHDGSVLEQVTLDGNYAGAKFSLHESGGVDTVTTNAVCFYPGTLIHTPDGARAVETLKRGDPVLTAEGVARPVSWLGRQTISTVFADPELVWPIRIKAGALGENVPSRDLILSPDHAVLVDGVLIHAGALVNGGSIVRQIRVPRIFTYYHVELDDHSLILAENTPAETFIDHPRRLAFDNWDEREALYPDGKDIEEMPYARAKAPRQVPVHVRVALAERAHKLGLGVANVA